jgi:hypothetical protein
MVIEKNGNTQECDNNAELDDMAIIEQDAHGEHFLKVLFFLPSLLHHEPSCQHFSKVLYIVALYSKYTRTLTFEKWFLSDAYFSDGSDDDAHVAPRPCNRCVYENKNRK